MRYIVATILLLLSLESPGQSPAEKILSGLETKPLSSFVSVIDSLTQNYSLKNSDTANKKYFVGGGWSLEPRDICPDYQEAIVGVDSWLHNFSTRYYVKFLAYKDSIFYYELQSDADQSGGEFATITNYKNDKIYNRFKQVFEVTYGAALITEDLFLTGMEYGYHCGIAGQNPAPARQMMGAVGSKNLTFLRTWLRSANAEKQLYAAKGLRLLEQKGYHLNADEQRIMKILQNKKGLVKTCSGCMGMEESISGIATEIANSQAEDIAADDTSATKNGSQILNLPLIFGILTCLAVIIYLAILIVQSKRFSIQ